MVVGPDRYVYFPRKEPHAQRHIRGWLADRYAYYIRHVRSGMMRECKNMSGKERVLRIKCVTKCHTVLQVGVIQNNKKR